MAHSAIQPWSAKTPTPRKRRIWMVATAIASAPATIKSKASRWSNTTGSRPITSTPPKAAAMPDKRRRSSRSPSATTASKAENGTYSWLAMAMEAMSPLA